MKITRIKKQKRRNKYKVFINNKYAFSLSAKALEKFSLSEADEYSSEELEALREKIELFTGEKALLHYLKYRFRSEKEIRYKLKLKKISSSVREKLVQKFKDYGYIDDKRFAENYLTDLLDHHPQGKYFLRKKMYKKGIASEIITSLFDKYVTKEKLQEMSDTLLNKKKNSIKRKDKKKRKQKALAYLQRKGFRYRTAKNSFDKLLNQD